MFIIKMFVISIFLILSKIKIKYSNILNLFLNIYCFWWKWFLFNQSWCDTKW